MNTIPQELMDGRRRRRTHSEEFKADAVAACMQQGISMAAVAMARGVNANLLRRWVREAEVTSLTDCSSHKAPSTPVLPKSTFLPMTLPAAAAAQDIRIELRRGAMSITMTWPSDAAAECAAWMRELLR
ncbi:MAG: transposase [Chitinophagaceae bacterium]|nr:transposase [Rubrivivax sp.]